MSRPFRFKQFAIVQDHAPMKVGTDGVLLGAWAGDGEPKHILDIGTGTGLIALMLAQRFPGADITTIEPNQDACSDAKANFSASPFAERLRLVEVPLQKFETDMRFDLIVSNPPFFVDSLQPKEIGRSMARHADSLGPEALGKASPMLSPNGKMAVVYPPETFAKFEKTILGHGLRSERRLDIISAPGKSAHRILGEFGKAVKHGSRSQLTVEKYGRHKYSKEYLDLTREFYLFAD